MRLSIEGQMQEISKNADERAAAYPEDVRPIVMEMLLHSGMQQIGNQGRGLDVLKYRNYNELVLGLGKPTFVKDLRLPRGVKPGKPKYCYNKGYTYVEGYASGLMCAPHAWCVNRFGRVIDPTWFPLYWDRDGFEGIYYFGVKMSIDFVAERCQETGHSGVFASEYQIGDRSLIHGLGVTNGVVTHDLAPR